MPKPTKKRSKKGSSRILPPPKGFSSWLAYAVTTMDTRHLALDHQWGNQPQWPDDMIAVQPLPEAREILLRTLKIERLDTSEQRDLAQALLQEHHSLGGLQAVGEQMHYAVTDAQGEWVGVLIFAAAALHLRPRDTWIGWSDEQRRRRLAFVANNVRFVLLPHRTVPNLGSAALRRVLTRLSDDWQERYEHPVHIVETFVDPERFQGTVYQASGWPELGRTKGNGRHARDFYENHGQPKRLFVRELAPNARRNLQAAQLKPALAPVEAKVPVRGTLKVAQPTRSPRCATCSSTSTCKASW